VHARRRNEGAAVCMYVVVYMNCSRFLLLPVTYVTALSLTQTVPVPGQKTTTTMMAHAPSPLALPCPTTLDAASRPTNDGRVAQHGLARLCTVRYGATVDIRPRPALLPSRTTQPTSGSRTPAARNPYRSVSTCSYRLSLTQATRANSLAHPSFG
jgi:hypothetical protein